MSAFTYDAYGNLTTSQVSSAGATAYAYATWSRIGDAFSYDA